MKAFESSSLGFAYVIDCLSGMSCMLCHGTGKTLLFRKGERDVGICESCSNLTHWAWRQLAGEIPPGFSETENQIARTYVLIARRRQVLREDADLVDIERTIAAPAEINTSWEFMFLDQLDGSLDLPSVRFRSNLLRGLADLGFSSWEVLMEPLYSSYTPRGHFVQVVLARGWAETGSVPLMGCRCWRPWPISAHVGAMAGFWRAMETIWPLRLYKHCTENLTSEMCVRMREAAQRYVELQSAVQEGRTADATMLLSLQASMSVDELAIARMLQAAAEKARDGNTLAVQQGSLKRRSPTKPRSVKAGKGNLRTETVASPTFEKVSEAENEIPDEEAPELEEDEMSEGLNKSDNEPEDPTFVRPRRERS